MDQGGLFVKTAPEPSPRMQLLPEHICNFHLDALYLDLEQELKKHTLFLPI